MQEPNRIREIRIRRGMSQTQLACRAGVAGSMLSDAERGVRHPYPKMRRQLARVLGVPVDELFPPSPKGPTEAR